MKLSICIKPVIVLLFLLSLGFSGCNRDESELEVSGLVEQTIQFKGKEVFELKSLLNTNSDSRLMLNSVPEFSDLVYRLSVYIAGENRFEEIKNCNFDFESLKEIETITLALDESYEYYFYVYGTAILSEEEASLAAAQGYSVLSIDIKNSFDDDASVQSVVKIISPEFERSQIDNQLGQISVGMHTLGTVFGIRSELFAPNLRDTIDFTFPNESFDGPRIFELNVDNTLNEEVLGNILFEMKGGNSGYVSMNIEDAHNQIVIARDWVESLNLYYISPLENSNHIAEKTSELGGYELDYIQLTISVPEIVTDESGEFKNVLSSSRSNFTFAFEGELYELREIQFGN